MVVKGALGDGTDNISIIANNTRGMVFLGTPFHGSPIATWGNIISTMVSVLLRTDTQKVRDLDQKSDKLQNLAESFASVLIQRGENNKKINVSFFHETKKLHGVLVSRRGTTLYRPDKRLRISCRSFLSRTREYMGSGTTRLSMRITPRCVNSPTMTAQGMKVCSPRSRRSLSKETPHPKTMFVRPKPRGFDPV